MAIPPTSAEADAAVPVAGTPTRSLVNAFLKNLISSITQAASQLTANPMAALVIDTTFALNTKTVNASSAFTFSAQPAAANTYFGLALVNGVATDSTITIPASYSEAQQAIITSFVLPANAYLELAWKWDGFQYVLRGEPVQRRFKAHWSFVGTTAARDYALLLKVDEPVVITRVVSRCASGTATATIKIDGVALGGTANAVSAAEVEQTHTTANVAALNTDVDIGFTAGSVDPRVTVYGYYL